MNLYLDIDGVILDKKQGCPAYGLEPFLRFTTTYFRCFWLTTHCNGDASATIISLASRIPKETLGLMSNIQPTRWRLWKTEAIDFTQPFYWLDDYAFDSEKAILREQGCETSLILVDLNAHPQQLEEIQKQFKNMICHA